MSHVTGRILEKSPTIPKLVRILNQLLSQVNRGANQNERRLYYQRRRQRLVGGE